MTDEGFYDQHPGHVLRLGDVLRGLPAIEPVLATLAPNLADPGYTAAIRHPEHSVVMSPCCSIERGVLSVAPLVRVPVSLFANPYVAEDLTRLNRPMLPEQALPPAAWAELSDGERTRRMAQGPAYGFVEVFVYASHALLRPYELTGKDRIPRVVEHYMVDFRTAYRVSCHQVQRRPAPGTILKVLQLSALARDSLRGKLSNYFTRVPEEDVPFLNR